ncbi:unnamed protein product [Urochloa decumbens]|uniref:F-box domain-containing protein n=1 Tax=Urochloa decumbens TaxID=240449 RepID=A0ABC9E243_9POAL
MIRALAVDLGVRLCRQQAAAVEAAEEGRISALPVDLRLRILALLPLNSAIRTGALSSPWRALRTRRWPAPAPPSLDLHHRPTDDPDLLLDSLERRGRQRLDRFVLTLGFGDYRSPKPHRYLGDEDIHRCLDYAAACDVEDLHIDIADHWLSIGSTLSFPSGFSHLVRLSLLRVDSVSFGYSLGSSAFPALEIIHLHSADSVDLNHLVSASPCLRTLDLRYCEFLDDEGVIYVSPARGHLRSLTVAECNRITGIHADRAYGLRSLRLSSALFPTYNIPSTAPLEDLYICLRGHNYNPMKQWIKKLPNLTNLTVLTICGTALQRVYALARFGSPTCLTKLRSLPSLRGLQLLMFAMASTNLAHIYMFLRTCRCPQLERLFVQLPTGSHDTFMGNSSEVVEEDEPSEVSKEDDPDEMPSKEDDSDKELSEEDETDKELYEEDETDEELYEEDETDEELSEEDETEEELLKEERVQEYMLEERPYYEDVHDEDPLDVPSEEQSEEDVPEYGLNNLMIAKMMKFKGHYCEMRLISFLLRKAPALKKLLLVSHKGHIEALGKDTLDISYFMNLKLLGSRKASPDAKIILSETDFAANQPVHSDVFARF